MPIDELALYLFHQGTNYEAYKLMCPRPTVQDDAEGWLFHVWAPNAKAVSVVGDFNDWNTDANPMTKVSVGVWEAFVPGAQEWQAYRYRVQDQWGNWTDKTDPYALHCETPPRSAGKLTVLDGYQWGDADWMARRGEGDIFNSPVSIYEMHLGSWRVYPNGTTFDYRKVADELIPYLRKMHYTHVEFLPLSEHPLLDSWGYQCTGMFAATSRYGAPHDLMYLIDSLHRAGFGVILDWVPAHFPKDSFGLARFDGGCLYEYEGAKGEHPQWGTLIYDYGRNEVRSFLVSSAMFWFDAYHIDGIRMDAVSSMLYLDFGREQGQWSPNVNGTNINLEARSLLQTINGTVHLHHKGALMIAEESTAYPKITAPTDQDGLGFDFKWNMGWMNDTLRYVGTDPIYRQWMHNNMTFGMMYAFSEHFILALSHDEVVHGKGSLLNKQPGQYDDKFGGLMTYLGYAMAHPGKKLQFMGYEIGQFVEWNFRRGLDWFLLDYEAHSGLQQFVADLNAMYLDQPALYDQDCSYDGFQWLLADEAGLNILAWRRIAKDGDSVIALMNFSPVYHRAFWLGVPQPGTYRVILDSTHAKYHHGDTPEDCRYDTQPEGVNGFGQHIVLDVKPNSVQFLKLCAKEGQQE